ncbi:SRPBCC family protein [Rhizobium herbae]|uniref:SRPBCC family protein n=1 Tax=Rhizobium herbae TaxID=508661 RepID=A0ABS7H7C1_9HYPH|nr:SRPBCC family protein [Rhizobium herbae]
MTYTRSAQTEIEVAASAEALFDYLDDPARLGAHMQKPSAMMLGGRMTYGFDEAQGRAVGSVIRMVGTILGGGLSVEEVVVERQPPHRKVWETRGRPNLLVIGAYRMGFEIAPSGKSSRLLVFIDYDYPSSAAGRIVGAMFGPIYARWCINRMIKDVISAFHES